MAWVLFKADFDFSPAARNGWVTIAYKAGTIANVTRECAGLALAADRAEKTGRPSRENQ
ncbi:hypothetical protein JJB09_18585 [Rhizobium sp. KVB221]|uniref:Uncharacterized protein n=1 Tax=Rhizobium setariae TaxID=2801340 RepID=A0A937CR72_9HYPH|nr:hypothetical protein [Rhizobium setariae]MBL0374032.1 hypothetical protein [Rhizobium setariae]